MSEIKMRLPLSVQSFEKLREGNFRYVDKTAFIDKLRQGGGQYFLSRPRRFGKSLFLSTLCAYWEGKRELFSGLAIEKTEDARETPWQVHPVFYFDFNRDNFQQPGALESLLDRHLKQWEAQYGCEDRDATLAGRFQNLLVQAYEQAGHTRCVVLVDEYDKPLLETLQDPVRETHNKDVIRGFFSTLKSYDSYLEFVLITGVAKFSKVSIFSDLNQLKDISMNYAFSDLCGITEAELRQNFTAEIHLLAENSGLNEAACLARLRKTYDGYRFHPDGQSVYNPFSLLNAFDDREFGSYWFESGTPTFLVRMLKNSNFDARHFTDRELYATAGMLSEYRADNPDPVPLLYQTGYLTIVDYDKRRERYTLGVPNDEVKYGLLENLLPEYVSGSASNGRDVYSLDEFLETGNTEGIRAVLTALFASLPYTGADDPFENYFQSIIYIVFTLLGKYVRCEIHSAKGRADCVVESSGFIYLFEFKLDGSVEDALTQIEEKGYALPYLADSRTLYKIGVTFSTKDRSLKDWKEEKRS